MSKPHTLVLLGADRVGKSTIAQNTLQSLLQNNFNAVLLHFSGPKPHHSSPIEQYILPFDEAKQSYPEFIICDRGFSEVCFYDKFRRHVNISHEWAQAAESYFSEKSSVVSVFLINREWEQCRQHHIEEILASSPNSTEWWINNQLQMREAEHHAYYEYMNHYLENLSLLPHHKLASPSKELSLIDLIPGV